MSVTELAGKQVDQVLIGSCTNSSYRDLRMVAEILRGRTVKQGVSFGVAPGSRQVLQMLAQEGYLSDIIGAGGRILESACGFCIGNHMSPGTNAVSLRTSNRNFEGRSGTKSAQVYLVSPEVAAIAALTGEFANPLTAVDEAGNSFLPEEPITMPQQFLLDDSLFITPSCDDSVEILRGPNIGNPPESAPLVDMLGGFTTIKVGDNITTDHIMPAGARLKYRSNIPKYAEFVFESVDADFFTRASGFRDMGIANVVVAGESYGQGSSREHAALCPRFLGVQAVVAKSIERIHMANLFNFGIIPLIFENPADYDTVGEGDLLIIENLREQIAAGATSVVMQVRSAVTEATSATDNGAQSDGVDGATSSNAATTSSGMATASSSSSTADNGAQSAEGVSGNAVPKGGLSDAVTKLLAQAGKPRLVTLKAEFTQRQRDLLLAGGLLKYTKG